MEIQLDSGENRMFIDNEPDQDGEYEIAAWSEGEYIHFYFTKEQIETLRKHLNTIKQQAYYLQRPCKPR